MAKKNHNKGWHNYGKVVKPPCHIGFKEVYPNIYVGSKFDVDINILSQVDVLIPLDSVDGNVWNLNYNGEICYIPIVDYSVLPKQVEEKKVQHVLNMVKEGKKIAIFCLGGHGRTGYFASLILGKLGVKDPIGLLRSEYCENAVETNQQVDAVASFLNNELLREKYKIVYQYTKYDYGNVSDYYGCNCGVCLNFEKRYGNISFGYCQQNNKTVNGDDICCSSFR